MYVVAARYGSGVVGWAATPVESTDPGVEVGEVADSCRSRAGPVAWAVADRRCGGYNLWMLSPKVRKVALLVPAMTYRATDFLAAARSLDIEVLVVSDERLVMAGDTLLSPLDPEAANRVVAELSGRGVDAVVAVEGRGQVLAAAVGQRLGVGHQDPTAVARSMDKYSTRTALAEAGISQPQFELVAPGQTYSGSWWPVIMKPLDRSGGQGVVLARTPAEAEHALARIRAIIGSDAPVLAEAFVEGPEVAIEGLLTRGSLHVLAIFDKPGQIDGPTFPETMLVTPSRLAPNLAELAVAAATDACAAIGLREGPVHIEIRIDEMARRADLIELNPRSIGGLCSRTLRFGPMVSLEELVLRHALGWELPTPTTRDASGVLMIPVTESGVLHDVAGVARARAVPGVEDVVITAARGSRLVALPEGGDQYLGFVFVRGDTPDEVETALTRAWSHLVVRLHPVTGNERQ